MHDENGTDGVERKVEMIAIEFQQPAELLKQGIIPFPIKRVELEIKDVVHLNVVLNFYENLIREFWCKGKLKT